MLVQFVRKIAMGAKIIAFKAIAKVFCFKMKLLVPVT